MNCWITWRWLCDCPSPMARSHLPSLLVSPCFLQAATLSYRRLCLGNIPDCTKADRLVFLNNILKNKAVVFAWQISCCKEKVSPLWSTAFLPISVVAWKDLTTPFSTRHSILGNWLSTRWWKKKQRQGLGQGERQEFRREIWRLWWGYIKLELQNVITNLRTLSTSKGHVCS